MDSDAIRGDSDAIRASFAAAMSAMYRTEVPQYGELLEIVATINREMLARQRGAPPGATTGGALDAGAPACSISACSISAHSISAHSISDRLIQEQHGAIRVGTAAELRLLRRLFAVMGMVPVGYYDLSAAGLPVHSTAFRATGSGALARSPFRLFTSLLRLDLIEDAALRHAASEILQRRRIVTPEALALIEIFEARGELDPAQAQAFVAAALESFRWHGDATVDSATYRALRAVHPLIADIVCFKGPHINHLTPRVLDIDAAQAAMLARGMPAKQRIEGPPRRRCPILLRQTSFKALSEPVRFGAEAGAHTARFGEIEQRGAALTRKGRALYDTLLASGDPAAFDSFPDDLETLRREELVFCRYLPVADMPLGVQSLEEAILAGSVRAEPIQYEDFLPVSAAGIFRSNLGEAQVTEVPLAAASGHEALEEALACQILDPFALYEAQSAASLSAIRL